MNNESKVLTTVEEINKHSTLERKYLLENIVKNKHGYPIAWPYKNSKGQRILLSFVDAYIVDKDEKRIDEEVANFDITEKDEFDKSDPLAKTKVKFISALFSNNRFVRGGVYYKGEYYTKKMTLKFAKYLTKCFMENFFHYEDRDYILEYFDKMENTNFLPYWPTKSYEKGKRAVLSAVNAYILNANDKSGNLPKKRINFEIMWGDTFDLNDKEDKRKIETVQSLLNKDRIVIGFYYKGKLIPKHLSNTFKLYLEKTFIKKNFTVNQRDFLFTYVTKDIKSSFPLFWPMKDKDNREIAISVVNATIDWLDDKYSNFDVYVDELFDLTKEEFQIKLQVIQELYTRKNIVSGGLYFDGMLIPSNLSKTEILRRKDKVEKALRIYIDDKEDFLRISKNFSIEDREAMLRLSSKYNNYYPDDRTKVELHDKTYNKETSPIVKAIDINILDEHGRYVLGNSVSFELMNENSFNYDDTIFSVLKALVNDTVKVRGALYYKGINIANNHKNGLAKEFKMHFLMRLLPADKYEELLQYSNQKFYVYSEDKKTKMPLYWATNDKSGRETLVSVVDADVHFKIGRRIVKAANNMNFDIYVGETFGLVGESGSGKTTISRAILGINKLTKGGIYYKGKLISSSLSSSEKKSTKKNIQMIFQDPAASLNERANIDYIVSEGLYNFKMFKTKEERIEKVTRMMRSVGLLPEHLSRYPHEFSGGQRQRIGIARALVIEPQLVLADEPISALDVSIRAQVLNLLKKLQKEENLTYLFIAHDLSIIRYISDRIAVMHQGYIVELGDANDIYSNPIHPYTKALLTAIPQPDPKSKNQRKKLVYNKGDIDYEKCKWIEAKPHHYVLATDELIGKWVK